MKVGMKFQSFEELDAAIQSYSKEKKIFFNRRDCKTFESAKNRSKRIKYANPKLKYYSIKYSCQFHSRFVRKKPPKEGVKPRNRKINRTGCEAHIKLLLSYDSKYLEVISLNEDHNHPISEVYYMHHTRSRKLTAEDREKVKNYLLLKANKKLLLQQIRKETGKLITMKDLHNLADRAKREQSSAMVLDNKNPSSEIAILSHPQGTSEGISNAETMSAIELLNMIEQQTLLVPANPEIQEGGCETIVVEPDHINPEISTSPENNNNDDICSFETGMDFYSEQFSTSSVEETVLSDPPAMELGKVPPASSSKIQKFTTRPMVHRFLGRPKPIWSCHAIQEEEEKTKNDLKFDLLRKELAEHTKILQRHSTVLETVSASLQSLVHLLRKEREHS